MEYPVIYIDDQDGIVQEMVFLSDVPIANNSQIIEGFSISEPGKECEAVENGVIAFDGAKPINPSGGLIGCGHPVGASGARMFVDLYKQVTGKAGKYQVKDAKNGMMLNIGGSATTNYVFIVGKE